MLGKPRIRLNNLKTSLRFPCLGLNPIIDSIYLTCSTKPGVDLARCGLPVLKVWIPGKCATKCLSHERFDTGIIDTGIILASELRNNFICHLISKTIRFHMA